MNFDEELAALSKEFKELREENARLKEEIAALKVKLIRAEGGGEHVKTA